MSLGTSIVITADEHREIFRRLQPYLPSYLRKVLPARYSGLRFVFAPFTGREEEPARPRASYGDPVFRYVREDADPVEHKLTAAARQILDDLYEQARREWRDAAYVADLRDVVRDAGDRWKAYEREGKVLESAYGYLRTPEAAREWPSALSRLVDAQDRTVAAAGRFDERAEEIAQVHEKHLYADLGHDAALARAGHPEAGAWHIVEPGSYHSGYHSRYGAVPLVETVRRLIEQQDAHLAKVGRLSGTTG
ncbi:hypothetical protein ACJ6WF_48340 [Streptomyces sp. MMS24-I2-30]|uniref:hypothetical protein n=1 Tax=Streptomyces sp. MMS24-I2-30 TaxID=3351564 RepID=UPI003896BE19